MMAKTMVADWPDGIDMEALLAPIPGDVPTGADLREDFSPQSFYLRLRDARSEARAAERAADANPGEDSALPPQWRTVRELSLQALATKTKDLEFASWLTEALVRSDGLRGLAAGAHLIGGLASAYWDGLYLTPDEDGIATRVAPVAGLNGEGGGGTLIQPLRKLPLFSRANGTMLAYWQYEQAEELKGIADPARVKQRLAAGVLPLDDLENEARAAGQARFAAIRASARLAGREWAAMSAVLDAKAGQDGPPTSHVRDLVTKVADTVSRYAPPDAADDVPEEAAADSVAEDGAGPASGIRPARATVSREDMLKELSRIAEYFKKTEPQSPLAYTLDEAVRRGRLSWPELLSEVISDVAARDKVLTQLGIRPPQE
jgi:type VI secretion system protein ImpA